MHRSFDGSQGVNSRAWPEKAGAHGRGRRERAESGLLIPGAEAPYGYRWRAAVTLSREEAKDAEARLEEDPRTSWVVRRIFAEAARGRGQEAIAADLTAEGVPTPTGKSTSWGQSTIRCILQNSFYVGRAASFRVRVYKDYSRGTKNGRVVEVRPEEEWVALPEGVVPPLVDADTFATVQERFRLNMVRAKRTRREPERLLLRGGYVKCGYCGHNMFVHRQVTD